MDYYLLGKLPADIVEASTKKPAALVEEELHD
jgi:hypothetical protein